MGMSLGRAFRARADVAQPGARVRTAGLALVVGIALAACDRGAPPTEPPREAPAAQAPQLAEGAAPVGPTEAERAAAEGPAPPSIWPDDVRPLAADLARRESPAECAARIRGALVPEVAEAIAGLGYERFVADLCGGLAAVRAGDVGACDALSVSSARAGCRRRLALVHARPEACPEDPTLAGREPVCLAWAARDAWLCRGAAPGERERCEAVLARDPQRCRALPAELRARCVGEVARHGPALGDAAAPSPTARPESALALTLTREDEPPSPADAGSDALLAEAGRPDTHAITHPALDRGVVAARCADGIRVRIGDPRRRGAPPRLDAPPEAELLLRFPADARRGPLRLEAATLDVLLRVRVPHEGGGTSAEDRDGHVRLDAHDVARGAPIAGQVELTVTLGGQPARVRGSFRTFVRDLVDADAPECAR